ncbi:MAG: hypothetical protein WAO91_06805 [Candidatus Nitrosotenuis sp.]
MDFTEIPVWVGYYIMVTIIAYLILRSTKMQTKVQNDNDALRIVRDALEIDELKHYEVTSIVRMNETNTTTVIVETDTLSMVVEIDNITGKVINKEKLVL